MLDAVTKDIWAWAIANSAHTKYETLQDFYEAFWKEHLNSSDDSLYFDESSEPFNEWDFASPQPETNVWDLN